MWLIMRGRAPFRRAQDPPELLPAMTTAMAVALFE